jgi:hypothetical protein
MVEKIEDELDRVNLKYSDADIEEVLKKMFTGGRYEFLIKIITDEFKSNYITKMES